MKVIQVIHKGYKEWETIPEKWKQKFRNPKGFFGKYQYLCSSKKGEISLVELLDYFHKGKNIWEIYCLAGNLFDDVERFDTKKSALKRIRELLK